MTDIKIHFFIVGTPQYIAGGFDLARELQRAPLPEQDERALDAIRLQIITYAEDQARAGMPLAQVRDFVAVGALWLLNERRQRCLCHAFSQYHARLRSHIQVISNDLDGAALPVSLSAPRAHCTARRKRRIPPRAVADSTEHPAPTKARGGMLDQERGCRLLGHPSTVTLPLLSRGWSRMAAIDLKEICRNMSADLSAFVVSAQSAGDVSF